MNLIGRRFGKLLVTRRAANDGVFTCWWAKCDCGNISVVRANNLKQGSTHSCGCLKAAAHKLAVEKQRRFSIGLYKTAMRGVKEKL